MTTSFAILGALAALAATAAAAGQVSPPTTRVANCMTGECHAAEVSRQHLHGPVAAGACEVCHVSVDDAAHRFALKRQGAELCAFCHIGTTDQAGLRVHQPVVEGRCTTCHDPHGSEHRMMLRGGSPGAMCLSCHAAVVGGREHLHAPVRDADCTACHLPHASILPNLLEVEGRALCLRCHADIMGPAPAAGASAAPEPGSAAPPPPMVHEPVKTDCRSCHDAHASDHESLLTRAQVELCWTCHESVVTGALGAAVHHAPVTDGKACLNCHEPHVAPAEHMLRKAPLELCLECHRREVKREDGSLVSALALLTDPAAHLHGPVADGSCRACHDPHGAMAPQLLEAAFPKTFYERFEPQRYALCFKCHDQGAFERERTTTLTAFRDGDRNLHYVHVIAPGSSGRSCRVCHEAHASKSPRMVRETTAFGQWQIPIRFTATDNGGSCAGGCHRAQSYDRGPADPPAGGGDAAPQGQ